jgi:exonuclease III
VGILIRKELKLQIITEYRDQNENILLLKLRPTEANGGEVVVGAIYGPNSTDRNFFNYLDTVLSQNQNTPVVLAGDWNTTWDNSPPESNIDIINMARTPNQANGRLLKDFANKFEMTDPFRALNPTKIGFSYSPFGVLRKNRSRLDFFLVSSNMLQLINNCEIFSAHLSFMFDHKPIELKFGDPKKMPIPEIRSNIVTNWFLDDPLIKMSVELSAVQIFSHSVLSLDLTLSLATSNRLALRFFKTIPRKKM